MHKIKYQPNWRNKRIARLSDILLTPNSKLFSILSHFLFIVFCFFGCHYYKCHSSSNWFIWVFNFFSSFRYKFYSNTLNMDITMVSLEFLPEFWLWFFWFFLAGHLFSYLFSSSPRLHIGSWRYWEKAGLTYEASKKWILNY